MKYSLEIGKIIEGSIKYDFAKIKNYTGLLIEKLKKDGEYLAAKKFEKLFDSAANNVLSLSSPQASTVPIDQESKVKLADTYYPSDNEYKTILNCSNQNEVDLFVASVKHSDALNKLGLDGSNTLLLYGPPGCGKTNCAFMIARELDLPIVVARLDSLISSYLGTTSKNIRQLFDYVSRTPCVLLLDEFDAIAKARDDKNELGELKRVVNTLLQNIDSISNNSVIIAATNHAKLLDTAVWRRFEYKIEIDKPDLESRKKLIKLFVGDAVEMNEKECIQLAACFENESGSSIKENIVKTMKRCVISGTQIEVNEFYRDLFSKKARDIDSTISAKEKIKYLLSKNTDEKYFTYSDIAIILGVSKAYVSMLVKEIENEQ